jgi:hypothetical protein
MNRLILSSTSSGFTVRWEPNRFNLAVERGPTRIVAQFFAEVELARALADRTFLIWRL